MTVIIQRRDPETDALNDIGRIDSGEIINGEDTLGDLFVGDIPSEDDLLDRFRGSTLFAKRADTSDAAEAAKSGRSSPLDDVPILPDDTDELNKDALVVYVTWVRQGRPRPEDFNVNASQASLLEARSFNPSLHPRGPDGKFVERPWDVPDSLEIDGLRQTPTLDLLKELDAAGEPIDDILAEDGIRIDGIPDDVNSLSEAEERLGGDGLAFQDLELNDQVEIVNDDGQLTQGTIKKTEQIDGAPNLATVVTDTGMTVVADVPEGATIRRSNDPVLPPSEVTKQDPLAMDDIQPGDQVAITTGYQYQDQPTFEGVGTVSMGSDIDGKPVIQVNGNDYNADHQNIQVFDAEPETIAPTDVEEGDVVSAWTSSGGTQYAQGEITDTTEIDDATYATITDQETGEDVQVNLDQETLKDPLSVPGTEDFDAVNDDPDTSDVDEALDDAIDQGVVDDLEDDIDQMEDGPGPDQDIEDFLDEANPEDVSVDDVEDSLVSIDSGEIEGGDWVAWADSWDGDVENIGYVNDVSTDGQQMLINQDGEIEDIPAYQNKLHQVETGADTSDIAPGSIGPDDISVADTTEVTGPDDSGPTMSDIQEGDFVAVDPGIGEIQVGRVTTEASSDVGSIIFDPGQGEGSEGASLSNNEVRLIDDSAIVQAGSDEPPVTFQSSEADGIDPSTVSAEAINSDQVQDYDFASAQEGDWVTYEDDDGNRHAGIVNKPAPSTLNVKTGHVSDPQKVLDTDSVKGVDSSVVTDVGSPSGSSQTTTGGSTTTPSAHFDPDSIEGTPNADVVDPDDIQRGVVSEEDGSIGMLDGDTVQAFQEFMADPDQGNGDILDSQSTETTSKNSLSFPRNDWKSVRDHVAHFASEVEGINAPEANKRAGSLLNKISSWKGKSYNDNGQTIERWFHGGVDLPGDYRNDGLEGDNPDNSAAAVSALMTAATQGFLREKFDEIEQHDPWGTDSDDDEISVYRGIGRTAITSLAKDWAEDPNADSHSVKESKVTNWTTDSSVADSFSTDQHQLKKSANVEDAIFSPDLMTGSKTGISTESEIWFTGGVSEADPEDIRVDGHNGADMTMADINDPYEMSNQELRIVTRWADRMKQKNVTLDNEDQIETFRRAREVAEDSVISSSYVQNLTDIINQSEQELEQGGEQVATAEVSG